MRLFTGIPHASFPMLFTLLLLPFAMSENTPDYGLRDLELLTKLAVLKHYPEFLLHFNDTGNFTSGEFESALDELVINLRKLDSTKDIELNCTMENDNARRLCNLIFTSKCLSSKEMISIVPGDKIKTKTAAVTKLCPLLLFQSHEKSCKVPDKLPKNKSRPSTGAVWGFGILFVTIISSCSLIGVVLLPLLNKHVYQTVLMLFEGLAVGSLASSAVFHLIPQAFNLLGEDAQHGYLWKALIIFVGIYMFFLSERFMKIFISLRKKKEPQNFTSANCNNVATINGIANSMNAIQDGSSPKSPSDESIAGGNDWTNDRTRQISRSSQEPEIHSSSQHEHNTGISFVQGHDSAIGTVAWMIIFGDGLHNFIDGLSIGAAFSESVLAGISISVAVVCEEFPHELGDFAVLLSAGMTMRQALMYNFLSACTCYLGLVFGILLGDLAEGSHYIFALAGGMFLYISLVDMMGELSDALDAAQNKGVKEALKIFFIQNLGIIIGVVVLFVMARYSEKINFNIGSEKSATEHLSEIAKAMGNDHYNLKALYKL